MILTRLTDEIGQTVAVIFQTMMDLEVTPCFASSPAATNRVAAMVRFAGNWSGALLLEVDASQACFFAARFLSIEQPAAFDDEVRDVLGELANMIGGNLKGTVAPGAILSIPEIIDISDFTLGDGDGSISAQQAFRCQEGIFRVSLVQAQNGPAGARSDIQAERAG